MCDTKIHKLIVLICALISYITQHKQPIRFKIVYNICMIKRAKHVLLDIVGVLLIIISPLLGWIPGPGGIPLLLAGLSLLAVNHSWAKRWLKQINKRGSDLVELIFVDHTIWKIIYDIVSTLFVFVGIYFIYSHTSNFILSLAIFALLTGLGLFAGNRKRLQRFIKWIKN